MRVGQNCFQNMFTLTNTLRTWYEALLVHLLALSWFPEFQTSDIPEIRNSGFPGFRKSGFPDCRNSGVPDFRKSGFPDCRSSGIPKIRISGIPHFGNSGFWEFRTSGTPDCRNYGFSEFRKSGISDFRIFRNQDKASKWPRNASHQVRKVFFEVKTLKNIVLTDQGLFILFCQMVCLFYFLNLNRTGCKNGQCQASNEMLNIS